MMNDPLLNQPWGPPTDAASDSPALQPYDRHSAESRSQRVKHPAASSRILAVGFSVAAVIGMSAAYTKAQRQLPTTPVNFDGASNPQLNLAPAVPSAPVAPAQQQPSVQQPQNQVVEIPVPEASPATGGYAPQNPGPTRQQSSGSH